MINGLYESCGYLASYLGTFLEGEVLLLTSIMSAKMGFFNYYGALVAGFLGAYTKDWIKFLLAKKRGASWIESKPKWKNKLNKNSSWFDKYPLLYMSIYRLMYGFSTIVILLAGLKDTSYFKFGITSAISIFLWISIVGSFGYFCAEVMLNNFNIIGDYKLEVLGVLVLVGIIIYFLKHRKEMVELKTEAT